MKYANGIFRKIDNTTKINYKLGSNANIDLSFSSGKYGQIKDDTLVKYNLEDINDCGFASFMIDFIDIRHFAKYLTELDIFSSFKISSLTLK